MNRLDGRVALITGAGQGIGLGIAERFGAEGASVAVCDRDTTALSAAIERLTAANIACIGLVGDVQAQPDVDGWVHAIEERFGPVDVLVNNAGVVRAKPFVDQTPEDWDVVVGTNLKGTFLCCRAVLPGMIEHGWGNIINITSMAALQFGGVAHVPYSAAKAGVIALTRDLAQEVGPLGIRVNAIAPGPILTPLAEQTLSVEVRDAIGQRVALRHWGSPADIAGAAVFLASDDSGFVTGITMPVSGG